MMEARNISLNFGALAALHNINISLQKGRSMALIGPTAAGKSLLLKSFCGLTKPQRGDILIDGAIQPVTLKRPVAIRDEIGMLFQHNALFDSLPVWQNISFRQIYKGMGHKEAHQHACSLLEAVGLEERIASLSPAELSGGMQKRVGLARAISTKPKYLLLDNPTAGLDPVSTTRVNRLIARLARDSGAAILVVTSVMARLSEFYDEIAVLHDGILRWHGPAKKAESDPNPYLQQLLSASREGPIEAI